MSYRLIACLLLAFRILASAESELQPDNLRSGKLIPKSTSPDGKHCLLEVFHGVTTKNSVVLATSNRSRCLAAVHVCTEFSTDAPHEGRTDVLWSSDSKRVAIHDSSTKHSKLFIYRLTEAGAEELVTHNLLEAACAHWGIKADSVVSSGQRPIKWLAGDILLVEVTARLKGSKQLRHTFPVHAPLRGRSLQQ